VVAKGEKGSGDRFLSGDRVGKNGLAHTDAGEPALTLGRDESFEAGLVFPDGIEEFPTAKIDEGVVVSLSEEVEAGEIGIVRIEEDTAAELVGLSDFENAVRSFFDTNVDVFVATDEGVNIGGTKFSYFF